MRAQPKRRWSRPLAGVLMIIVWLAVAGVGGPYFGRIGEVSTNEQASYLPSSAESTQVQRRLSEFFGDDSIPAVVVAERAGGLTTDDLAWLAAQSAGLPGQVEAASGGVSPALASEDGMAAQIFVPLSLDTEVRDSVADLRTALATPPEGLAVYVTGAAGLSADLGAAFGGVDSLLLLVAVLAVFVLLVAVYRSPLLPIMVLLAAMSALCAAVLVNFYLAKAGILKLNGQVQGILFILVIGAATDYSLLYVSRFREALGESGSVWDATKTAWKGSVEAVVASGGTVIAGLLCLLLSDLASNRALGPVATIGIVFAVLVALTFLPAMLLLAGRVAFWPRRLERTTEKSGDGSRSMWERIAGKIQRRARPVWMVVGILLAIACIGLVGLKAGGVPASDLVMGESQARDGQNVLAAHFPGGSGQPVQVIVPEARLGDAAAVALGNPGVSSASVVSADSPSGSIPLPAPTEGPLALATPTVAGGDVMLQVTLIDKADSLEAEQTVVDLRSALRAVDPSIAVGGSTALDLDTNLTSTRDRNLIIPVVLVVITLILMVLLRSIVAPLLLMVTTVLSFGAALGITSLVFNHLLDFPGADPSVPLYGFVFLVALGIDYNIFLMTRVREESLAHGTKEGVLRGLVVTGGVITSAGVVLAATFAALAVIPILFLVQLAVIVAFGVLLDALVVRALFVPALVHDVGERVWWPSKSARHRAPNL
ncbi:MAG: MMPL family transporter [Thermoleophilia bacterium]|nr:MMPL family transporter [Thermoleophilia bacterium]